MHLQQHCGQLHFVLLPLHAGKHTCISCTLKVASVMSAGADVPAHPQARCLRAFNSMQQLRLLRCSCVLTDPHIGTRPTTRVSLPYATTLWRLIMPQSGWT